MTGIGDRGAFRQDVQGLRAIAVVLVLVYHLWPGALSGGFVGVDAFFVISGFLITAHLLQHPPHRPRDLAEFWGRRIRRLLPAAFLVLVATAVAARLVAPETQWASIAQGVIASALYGQNWVLAASSVDYLAAAEAPTPTQHYWSLAIEEQFYLFWPLLILALAWLAARRRRDVIGIARVAMVAVIVASLAISIVWTATEPASAYFATPTRVWELALGGLLATLPPLTTLALPARAVDGVAWIGVAMLLLAGVVISNATPFPGYAALLPVVGTALVIHAGTQRATSPTGVLRFRPIQHVGDTSYSIYLWHWPLIVLAPFVTGSVGVLDSLAIVAATVVLATLTKKLVEDPFRFAPRFQGLLPTFRLAAAGMVVVAGLGGLGLVEAQLRAQVAAAATADFLQPGDPCLGSASIVRNFDACPQDPASTMVPDPAVAKTDRSDAYRDGCWIDSPYLARTTCTYGDGPTRVALVGNSHAGEWLPALQVLAERRGWTITTFLASQCNATDAALQFDTEAKTANCLDYGRWVLEQTSGSAFDLVITSERQSVPTLGDTFEGTPARAASGYASYLAAWSEAGTNVLVLQDTPDPGRTVQSIPDCLALHRTDQGACGSTPARWSWMDPLYTTARSLDLPGLATLPTRQFFCTSNQCPAVIGHVVVYFDASHMTATYARTLAPFLDEPITAAIRNGPSGVPESPAP